ncbi:MULTISPECIES: DUF4252 domain-containing protein [Flavobacteriaceae]|uniref:DUF4252 domain-containing protein n=2 Tax=Flavobacteriaceae TaxID=49546 RepID=A0A4Y8ASA1_9FLAO|nr:MULTISPECIES: DUF4252 domain-containing protein [Flavobacteriaceae]TEW74075.1 DUF4252 domain-containing protein [Gramella jeungdoensis]GGK40035.1 hypothetical protein GCM10007963_05190 [Lutibacter litoralis]
MKNSFLILVTALLLISCASKSSFNSFYAEHKDECDFSISTPAFFANIFIPKDDVEEYKDLFRKVKHYKVMIFENKKASLDKQFDRFIKRKKYASIFKVKSNGDQVKLYFLENKNTIKEIVLKIKSDKDFVVLGLKTNILQDDFNKIMEGSDLKLTGI